MSESLKQKIRQKAKTTDEIAKLWNTYCKEGYTEVPQQIMEEMEAAWVKVDDVAAVLDEATKQIQESLDKKTKDDFKALLKKIALHMTKDAIKPEHAEQVLRDIDGDNHFVNVSWYFALGYSYALREVLAVLEGQKT